MIVALIISLFLCCLVHEEFALNIKSFGKKRIPTFSIGMVLQTDSQPILIASSKPIFGRAHIAFLGMLSTSALLNTRRVNAESMHTLNYRRNNFYNFVMQQCHSCLP